MNNLPILMTASVSTRGMKGAAFSDEDREQMYVETLRFYLHAMPWDQKIVFAENSGWDLGRIVSALTGMAVQERVEFISLDPTDFDVSRGKGYNELLLINKTLKQSRFIKNARGGGAS